ncbi:hypothetical protein [Pantoea agglomerans]|uniref:hypothetical protein n=2 Tax=Enterobacter agglomerans TaxID=549 RepID=UPI0010C02B80|nr:hypothetical protein [Pantoea agglomerans]TKK22200.1 hypothetical protein PagCFBP13516_03045 [Pantoea agglomerans]
MATSLDEASKQILGTLFAEFTEKDYGAEDLKKGYEGPRIELVATAVCNSEEVTKVDFEIAFSDLEKQGYIKTGPMAVYDNDPNSGVIIIGMYSKKEYVYLTEKGYKSARQPPNKPRNVQRVVTNIHISGGEIGNLQLASGETVTQTMNNTVDGSNDVVIKLIQILEQQGKPVTQEQISDVKAAVSQAEEGNAGSARQLLTKAFGSMWESANQVAWPLVAEIVKKSMGF